MDIVSCAKNILTGCMDVKPEENVLIVTDDNKLAIGQAFYEAAKELGCEALLMTMKERNYSGQEPPGPVADAMQNADVVLCPTAKSLTHTNAKIAAAKNGARIGTMPNIAEEMLSSGAMTADYACVEALTGQVTKLLTDAKTARIEKDGYVLTIDLPRWGSWESERRRKRFSAESSWRMRRYTEPSTSRSALTYPSVVP